MAYSVEDALKQAITFQGTGQRQDAVRLYRAILQAQPANAEANYHMGLLSVQAGQAGDGLRHLKAALAADASKGEYWLAYIDALIQIGDTGTARHLLQQGRQRGLQGGAVDALNARLDQSSSALPNISAELARAMQHRECGRYNEAATILQEWIARNPSDAAALAVLAQVLSLDKQDGPAWTALTTALALDPALPIVQRSHARLLLKQQRLPEALHAAQAAYQGDTGNAENQLILAMALGANNQHEQVALLLEAALQSQPDYAEAYANRALFKFRNNDPAGALADAEKALAIKPHLVQLLGFVGSLRYQFKDLHGAIAAYEQAYAHDHAIGHLVNAGDIRRQLGQLDAAISILEKATTAEPANAGAWVNLGAAYQEAQRIPEAKFAYTKALALAPDQAAVASNLGAIAVEAKDWEEAVRCFDRALRQEPSNCAFLINRAVASIELGRHVEAEQATRQAIASGPALAADSMLSLGYALFYLDDLDQAVIEYQRALASNPSHTGLKAAVFLSALCYLNDDIEQCQKYLLMSEAVMQKPDAKFKFNKDYRRYIVTLLNWWQASQRKKSTSDLETIFVVGESHSLAAHRTVVHHNGTDKCLKAEWIDGCKQWHLGNGKSNKYKHRFNAIFARLPLQSTILLTIGEIDCRSDEGMIVAAEKASGNSLEQIALATARGYITYVASKAQQYGHRLIIGGVPAPNLPVDQISIELATRHTQLIRLFNTLLKAEAFEAGMDFLDMYSLTDRGDGVASGTWHLDPIHLLPSATVEAFSNHYLPAKII